MKVDKVDGRRARGLRTRDAIVGALLDLIGSGESAPTAQRIADRAGVSVRSVYQHFTDVEGLYADASARLNTIVSSMRHPIDPAWPRERRVEEYVSQHAAVLEAITPFSRAARLMEQSSKVIQSNRAALQREHRERLSSVFGQELNATREPARTVLLNALDAATSWSAWEHLRADGLGARTARQAVTLLLESLLSFADR